MPKGPNGGANWKGGRIIDPRGYVLIWVGKDHPLADVRGYAYEHRLVAQEALDRPLTSADIIHHDDEQPSNNADDNLIPTTRAWHRVTHRKRDIGRRLPGEDNPKIECACGCGTTLLKFDQDGRPRQFLTGHSRKGTGRQNSIVSCECGCGATFLKYDAGGRPRRFVSGHNGGHSQRE